MEKAIIYFAFSLLLFSCKDKQIIDIDIPIAPVELDSILVWKRPLDQDTINSLSVHPILWNEQVITSSDISFTSSKNEHAILLSFDLNGNAFWRWNDYLPSPKSQKINNYISYDEEKLLLSSSQDNYCVNGLDGSTVWSFKKDDGEPYISYTKELDLVFKTYKYGNAPTGDSTTIEMTSIGNANFKEIYKIRKIDDYEVNIPTVSSYQNPQGDTILIFQNRQIIISPFDEKTDLYAYNLSKKEIQWLHEDLKDGSGSDGSNVRPPLIEGDYVYFAGKSKAYCFEKESGDLAWEYQFHHSFLGSNFILYNDLFITNLDNGDLMAINKVSGNYEWIISGLSGGGAELRIYQDKIYHANGDLYIIQADTGKILFQYKTPTVEENGRGNAIFLNAVAVDLENRMMYTTDGYYLLAMRLPDL